MSTPQTHTNNRQAAALHWRELLLRPITVFFVMALALMGHSIAFAQERNLELSAKTGEKRVALVIGNGAYKTSPLKNPVNDATDIADELQRFGFKVILRRDASRRDMRQAIREFSRELKRSQVGLFYFAGHGIQIKGGNYLVPVGADIENEADAEDLSIDANYVLRTMEEAQVKVSIVILDACRNNPYARSFRSAGTGLAQMSAATGSLIAFATAPGSVAADGTGRNGLYTQHLLESLRQPNTDILKVFQRVRANVVRDTGGKQTPWESTSLVGDFFFARPASGGAAVGAEIEPGPARPADPVAFELEMWKSVKDSDSTEDFEEYLRQYPQGTFAGLAQARMERLKEAQDPAKRHDGIWQGELETYGGLFESPVRVNLELAVSNGQISGKVFMYGENRTLSGRVDENGNLVDAKLVGSIQGYTLHGKLWEAGGEGLMGWKVRIKLARKTERAR